MGLRLEGLEKLMTDGVCLPCAVILANVSPSFNVTTIKHGEHGVPDGKHHYDEDECCDDKKGRQKGNFGRATRIMVQQPALQKQR